MTYGVQDPPALALVSRLCDALETEAVGYCHWKSTTALERSARGENDLDLLVRRADGPRFIRILHELGFKEARLPAGGAPPGVLSYWGYDAEADRFVHVHAHYQLVLGHDRTKNYRLPIEGAFLGSAIRSGPFRIPRPELEFVVLVVRMVLKHGTWDAILSGEGTLPASARRELDALSSKTQESLVHEVLRAHLPGVDPDLFSECLGSLRPGESPWRRVRTARRLGRQLRPYGRRPRLPDAIGRGRGRLARALRRRLRGRHLKKRLVTGGALIAVVGGDGAGKSTAVAGLYEWLAREFDVTRVHLGKPPRSWATRAVRAVLKAARTDPQRAKPRGSGRYSLRLLEVCVARDRYRAYRKAYRQAAEGGLVICDRFPLAGVDRMDAPRAERMTDPTRASRFGRSLARLERSYYRAIAPPDVLLVLCLDPEIAVRRKPEEDPALVRSRSREIWEFDWGGTGAHVVDASQPAERVLAELKSVAWFNL
jgi:thymidylate kinase